MGLGLIGNFRRSIKQACSACDVGPGFGVVNSTRVASLTVGWHGGWVVGIAGAAAGAASGWLYNRWLMPEFKKRRVGE
jgi:hypothetical protein